MTEHATGTFASMPRAIRWAIVAAIGILGFLVLDEYVWKMDDGWDKEARRIQEIVDRLGDKRSIVDDVARRAVALHGDIVWLDDEEHGPVWLYEEDEGRGRLNDAVAEVLGRHDVNASMDDRLGQKLDRTVLADWKGANQIDRFVVDVKFDANASTAFKIISELEQHPDVEAINSLHLAGYDGPAGKMVQVRLAAEAWVITRKKARGRARS